MATDFEIVNWVFDNMPDYEDCGKMWRDFRLTYQKDLPSGFGLEQFKPLYDHTKHLVETPLLNAAHKLTCLEREIITECRDVLLAIEPRDANHVRNCLDLSQQLQQERMDLETVIDNCMAFFEQEGIELSEKLQANIKECWPDAEDLDS